MKARPMEQKTLNDYLQEALDTPMQIKGKDGATIVAAEQLGRKARLMELDPHYCDVIIARWEKLTGRKAVRAGQ